MRLTLAWFCTASSILLLFANLNAPDPSGLVSAVLLVVLFYSLTQVLLSIRSRNTKEQPTQPDKAQTSKVSKSLPPQTLEAQHSELLNVLLTRADEMALSRQVEVLPSGQVYLLKAGPFYKIGKSKNAEKRIKQIKLQLPYPVEVVHVITTTEYGSLERFYHRKFESKRTNGEWFLLTDEDVREFVSHS